MIITNIVGGLGNQMFQYACAKAISLELNLPLKVTFDMFGAYTIHNGPELERVFSLQLEHASVRELRNLIGVLRASPFVRKLLTSKALSALRGSNFIVEPHYNYWDGLVTKAHNGVYLQGYWQSERYFENHVSTLRDDFTFRYSPSGVNAELQSEIRSQNSVSVHVRRGDYVSNPKTLSVHGVCSPEYYYNAIELVKSKVADLRLYVFSDDAEWASNTLKERYPDIIVIDHNHGEESYNDMRLMSVCKHHIIANSSFSWWGAWLNPNPNKIVVAPKQWFAADIDTQDLIPESWIRI